MIYELRIRKEVYEETLEYVAGIFDKEEAIKLKHDIEEKYTRLAETHSVYGFQVIITPIKHKLDYGLLHDFLIL